MYLTPRQKRFLELLRSFVVEHGTPPSLEEMRAHLQSHGWGVIASLNSIKQYFDALIRAGAISRTGGHRGIRLADLADSRDSTATPSSQIQLISIPLLGSPVACGTPTDLLTEHAIDRVQVSARLVRSPQRTYAFRVQGDSMDLAGIADGDLVLVESTPELREGDRVLATIDGCGTVKRLHRTLEMIILQPESSNPANKPIYLHPADDFVIAGKVVGILKQ